MRLTEHADVSSDATCKEALPQTGWEGLLFFYFSSCSVARWGATFGAFRGIGRGGLRLPSGVFAGAGSPSTHRCEEGKALLCAPLCGGAPPLHPGLLSFHDESRQRRARGAAPGPRWGALSSPQRRFASLPPEKDSATNLAGFATLRLHRNWFLFLLKLHQRNTGCFQTVARGLQAPNVSAVSGLCQVCVREFGFVKPFVGL